MNNYITLDSKKYRCPFRQWEQLTDRPMSARFTWNGVADVTFGNGAFVIWEGAIRAEVTPGTGFGSVSDIRNTLAKKSVLEFTDHYGGDYIVAVETAGPERSISAKWDGASNVIFFPMKIYKIAAGDPPPQP